MREAHVAEGAELPLRPHATHGVVGVAEQEERGSGLLDHPLERRNVKSVAATLVRERRAGDDATVVLDDLLERVVDRRLDDDGLPRLGEGAHGGREREDDARGQDAGGGVGPPPLVPFDPVARRDEVGVIGLGVAKDAVPAALLERLDGLGGNAEVHVGDPHGQKVGGLAAALGAVVLERAGAMTVDDLVEVVARIL